MRIKKTIFGETDGRVVHLYTLENSNGLVAKITTYGGILTEMHVPDADGNVRDIVLGFENIDGYLEGHPYFGAIVGRVANRIEKGKFALDGRTYELAVNNGPNHLHGGIKGFDKAVWDAEPTESSSGPALKLTYLSEDGEEGYPGNLKLTVIYALTHENELVVQMSAETDKATPVNIANHSYWNLAGQGSGDILGHTLFINADRYTPTDDTLIPTGDIEPVEGTPYDFKKPKRIGKEIGKIEGHPELNDPGGYDINFVLNEKPGELKLAARVFDPGSGRTMEVYTSEPGVQFYSGNFLDGTLTGKDGAVYDIHSGFCLETQHYPDSINKPDWPSVVLRPGETYNHVMVHKFFVK